MSTVLTSNKSFDEWGEIFGDDVMAAALIDRLVHHCHIVNIRGNSYRLRQHTELAPAAPWQPQRPAPAPPGGRSLQIGLSPSVPFSIARSVPFSPAIDKGIK